jgi:RNA polymerase sigma-70 factor (ECF subfamily)
MTASNKGRVPAGQSIREALAALYDQTFSRVFNAIRYRVEDEATAEELTARVYERALQGFAHYQPETGPVEGWLFGIVRHVVADHLRRQKLTAWLPWEAFLRRPAADPPVEETVAGHEMEVQLEKALPRLKDRERDLLGLKYGAGLTNRRIAALTGLSEQNVAVILFRALGRLRAMLDPESIRGDDGCVGEEVEHV